jgi:hypothetical protein
VRVRAGIIFTVIAVSVVAVVGALLVGNVRMFRFGPTTASVAMAHAAPGTKAEFTYLAAQTSNNCSLQPAAVKSYPDNVRIQGSCCSPMDWDHYREQVRDLRRYHAIAAIPPDPYDVSAALAKKLFAYGDAIHLTQAQQRVYRRAMSITPEKGPCCCKCWRWHAFAGLSKYLIARKHFSVQEVASVIALVDGCGGKD